MLTAHDEAQRINEAADLGISDYITKPSDLTYSIEKVTQVFDSEIKPKSAIRGYTKKEPRL